MKAKTRKDRRERRHLRIRRHISGTAEKPRMAIMVSNRHIHVQFIDDDRSATVAAVSTLGTGQKLNVATAKAIGAKAAEAALARGVKTVVVDRAGFKFHGRVKAVVDGMVGGGVRIKMTEEQA